jgi:dynein heavy chain
VPEEVKKVSAAAMSLCMWSRAMVTYDRVAKGIEPKKAALRQAESQLAATLEELEGKQAGLRAVQERVAGLQKVSLQVVKSQTSYCV